MNARICSIVATVTLLTLAPGCSGIRNFLSGRGARCGACNEPAPQDSCNPPQQPCASPAPCGSTAGTCGEVYGSAYSGGCGCNTTMADPYISSGVAPYPGQVIDVTEGVPADGFAPRVTQ